MVDLCHPGTKTLLAFGTFLLVVGSFGIAEGAIDVRVILTSPVDFSEGHRVGREGRDVSMWRVDPVDLHNV